MLQNKRQKGCYYRVFALAVNQNKVFYHDLRQWNCTRKEYQSRISKRAQTNYLRHHKLLWKNFYRTFKASMPTKKGTPIKMGKMGKGTIQNEIFTLAKSEIQNKPSTFSTLAIGKSMMFKYIRDETRRAV